MKKVNAYDMIWICATKRNKTQLSPVFFAGHQANKNSFAKTHEVEIKTIFEKKQIHERQNSRRWLAVKPIKHDAQGTMGKTKNHSVQEIQGHCPTTNTVMQTLDRQKQKQYKANFQTRLVRADKKTSLIMAIR